jgi:hypothetical protein
MKVEQHITYQVPVPMKGTTRFLDAWIPEPDIVAHLFKLYAEKTVK